MKHLLSLLLLAYSVTGLACKPSAPREINLHVDVEKGIRKFYSSKRLLDERPSLSMDSCRELAASKKYIMLGLGLENLVLTNDTMGFNFTPQEESLDCKLKNNPFSYLETKEDRFANNQRKRDFFNRCVVVQVTEFNKNVALRYPEKQPGCSIKKVSKWSVDFSGSYCFFQPYPESRYSIHLDVKPECMQAKSLSEKKTILSDYNALLNSYIAGDATGFSPDLTALTTTPVRLSMTPPSDVLALSEDFGSERPRWPSTWQGADIYLGELEIRNFDDSYDEIKLPIVANTHCERKCVGNLCSSPCEFSQPIVGEFTLYESVRGKKEFIKLWHDGSVASPNYQGLLHGMGVTLPKNVLENNKKYVIEAVFREPDLDFSYFSGRVDRELRLRQNYIGPLSRSGQINLVPQINTIGRPGEVPEIPVIQNLSFENNELDGLSRALATWQSKLDNAFWPPFYDLMCANGSCQKAGSGYVKLKLEFTINKTSAGEVDVMVSKGTRESNIVANASWTADQVPTVDCGLDINDDNDDFDWGDIL